MEKKPLSKALRIWYGVGDFMYCLSVTFKTYYWTYFLTTVIAIPLGVTAIINTVINVYDLIMAFTWGAIIDALKPGKWGRYRTMILVCAPLIVITHAAQWFAPTVYAFGASASLTAVLSIVAFAIYIIFFNLAWTANVSLIGVCASNEVDRNTMSSTRNAWLAATGLVVGYIAAWLLGLFKNPVIGYAAAATIMGALTIPGYYIHFKLTEGYELTPAQLEKMGASDTEKKENRITLKDIITVLSSNTQLVWVLLINIGSQLSAFVFAYLSVYLFDMTLGVPEMMAFYITVTNFGGVLGSIVANMLSKKMSIKTVVQIGFLVMMATLLVTYKAAIAGNAILFTASMIVVQFFLALTVPGILTFYTNCAVYSEWKTGINCTATIIGLCGVPIKVSLVAIGLIVPAVLGATGYVAGQAITEATKIGLAQAITFIPIGLILVSFLILTFLYKLDRKTVDRYAEEIAARKSAAVTAN